MQAESKDFEEGLCGEDADEAHVEVLEGEDPHLRLPVVVEGHGEHVQADEDHDDHVKLLVGHNPKHNGLWSPLKYNKVLTFNQIFFQVETHPRSWNGFHWFLLSHFLHGSVVFLLIFSHEHLK